MLLRYGDEVKSGERALKAGLAPGAGSGGAGGWVPFWAAGAVCVVGADMLKRCRGCGWRSFARCRAVQERPEALRARPASDWGRRVRVHAAAKNKLRPSRWPHDRLAFAPSSLCYLSQTSPYLYLAC